jgi:hypothetical protein
MNIQDKKISDEHLMELIRVIAQPTVEYMIKRIQNKIVRNKKESSMDINSFISVIISSLTVINTSTLEWLSASSKDHLRNMIDIDSLRKSLIKNINDQLGIKE